MDWNRIWDILNKIAIVGTIIGIPATLYGIYTLIYNSIVVYDMYHEPNDAGGMTLCISYLRRNTGDRSYTERSNRISDRCSESCANIRVSRSTKQKRARIISIRVSR